MFKIYSVFLLSLMVWMVGYSAVVNSAPTPRECTGLSWTAVTTDTEGETIAVDGYKLYSVADYSQIAATANTQILTSDLGLNDGNYEVVVTAHYTIDSSYLESDYSNSVTFKIVDGIMMQLGIPSTTTLNMICN